jgi:hypothetical protein
MSSTLADRYPSRAKTRWAALRNRADERAPFVSLRGRGEAELCTSVIVCSLVLF